MTEIRLEYEPRPHFLPFHSRNARWASLVCHRRAGKTVACINDAVTRAMYTQKENARYAYIAPFYRQAKDVAWQYLKDATQHGAAKKVRESQLRVELFNDSWITLYGADNPDALRGLYLDGVILDEYGDCRPSLWAEVLLPTLTDRQGWAVFIGTPKGHNHFYDIHRMAKEYKDTWYSLDLTVEDSGIIPQEELDEIKKQYAAMPEKYEQEFMCSFEAAIQGAYYANLITDHHVQDTPHDATLPVYMATDLGYSDSTAMWFWQPGTSGPRVLHYYEAHSKPLEHYFDYIDALPFPVNRFFLPHDAKAKSLQTGRSTIEQFAGHFTLSKVTVLPKLGVQHGIDAARSLLPDTVFDPQCKDGIEALRAYQRKYDEMTQAFADTPLHNWASHGADGFRYLAMAHRDYVQHSPDAKPTALPAEPVRYTLDQLYESRDSEILSVARMYNRGWS